MKDEAVLFAFEIKKYMKKREELDGFSFALHELGSFAGQDSRQWYE